MTEKRKHIFAPLSEQMTSILESTLGPGELGGHTTPITPKSPKEVVVSQNQPSQLL
ncbi:MAG: hypothetical protein GY943_34385 [Chloroflexi bacterium]|nr:hypothetical protein [Chloroflexota bacterium]